ncbi:MAG: DUF2318 domain-containing protein [Eubacterium sp.]
MADKSKQNTNKKKNNIILPIAAAVVVLIAIVSVVVPKLTKDDSKTAQTTQAPQATTAPSLTVQKFTGDIVIDESSVSETASFYDYDSNGTTVEVFAVKASDGTVRLALNTCQVCNGSPYAYFVQQGNNFICQNCKNAFERDSIGTVHGGCNPVPLTESDYQLSDGKITITSDFLEQHTSEFSNWKKF